MPKEELVFIPVSDGIRLSAKLFIPEGGGPFPAVIEALPYRKDDVTLAYEGDYRRLRDEGDYIVCRLDVRGTGSSEGIPEDEYTPREQEDICEVIEWLATQEWSSGSVGMFGTSYSGFNSLQVAMHRPPALKAIVSIMATDSRYTDDVHYGGGAQRGIDLVDYPHYMVPLNALPPAPHVYGEGWRERWDERLDNLKPWVLEWLEHQNEDDYWLQGSLKTDYSSIECAVMIVSGWADGYHNMVFRTLENVDVPSHLLAGPWSHMAPDNSIPGPHLDLVPEMIAWWDRWLRKDESSPAASWPKVRAFMRRATTPEPDLKEHEGEWWSEPEWPPERAGERRFELGTGSDEYAIRGDVGFYGSIWCAGTLPWGPPMDQRPDDAFSLTYDWDVDEEFAVLGHPQLATTIRSSVPVAYLSAKLCDVFPDGTSALVARGILNLTHRDTHADPKPLEPGEAYTVNLELDATSWIFEPGHKIRLSLATSDWPSSWSPPQPGTITIERDESTLSLPELPGGPIAEPPQFHPPKLSPEKGFEPHSPGPHKPVVWRTQHDVLARERRVGVEFGYAEPHEGDRIRISDETKASLRVSTRDPGSAGLDASYWIAIEWPEATVRNVSRLTMESDAETYKVHLELHVFENGEEKWTRAWDKVIPRRLQ
ncbi:MAG: CocE/NonD family hydrolase [Actinomycetota bacterium]